MFLYKGTDIRAALDDLRRHDGDPYQGIIVEVVNPHDGAPVFTTISYRAQLLRPGEATLPYRHSASTIFFAETGAGHVEVDGQELPWQRNDFFVVPNHRWRRLVNTGKSDAVLYSYTDQPVIEKIGHYRAQGRTAAGELVELA
jgi:gentisate 1,2-dioxygenase